MRGPGMHGFHGGGFGMGGLGRPMHHHHHHDFGFCHPPHHHHHHGFGWGLFPHHHHHGCFSGCLGCCTMLLIPVALIVLAVLIFVL